MIAETVDSLVQNEYYLWRKHQQKYAVIGRLKDDFQPLDRFQEGMAIFQLLRFVFRERRAMEPMFNLVKNLFLVCVAAVEYRYIRKWRDRHY